MRECVCTFACVHERAKQHTCSFVLSLSIPLPLPMPFPLSSLSLSLSYVFSCARAPCISINLSFFLFASLSLSLSLSLFSLSISPSLPLYPSPCLYMGRSVSHTRSLPLPRSLSRSLNISYQQFCGSDAKSHTPTPMRPKLHTGACNGTCD